MATDSFERDFGYLLPFMDRVEAAAADLSAESGAELRNLMRGEKQKWTRIRALLGGAAAAKGTPPAAERASAVGGSPGFTVGPLKR